MYSVDLKNIVLKGGLTCLFEKATSDESKLWHRRLGHLNFKTMNKLVKGNLVRGLPSKLFKNDQTCVACQKGKQHRASCKSKTENSISLPLYLLHMDLFGPTFVKSLKKKMYCLVVTDDYSRFTWVFFLATKDETSGILKSFITRIENLVDHKVKVIRCDNGTEFKNREMNQFCEMKGILRQFSVARTPQQNGVAERRNRTLIEAARTMLADSKLPTTFWAEAVNTACYVQNRVLVVKPHNKTPYELFHGRTPTLSFMRPFGCPVTILNTIDHLGKFDGKADKGFFVGYSLNSSRPDWLFDIDALTRTMNYEPIDDRSKPSIDDEKKVDEDPRKDSECNDQEKEDNVNSTNNVNVAGTIEVNAVGGKISIQLPFDPNMPTLEDVSIFDYSNNDEDDGAKADMNNLDITIQVGPILTTRIHKDHPLDQLKICNHLHKKEGCQRIWRNMDLIKEPKKIIHALKDPSWIEAMQEELLQFKIKAIRLFLAYASFKDFAVYQMDMKRAFLYGMIEEEVYVCQPPGFKDPDFPDRVYKKELCLAFEKLMHEKFQMSSMGELTFFLGLQVQQKKDGIFISQDKYVAEILKKFGFIEVKTASTPMETQKPLLKDEDGEEVDVHIYMSMIGSLMYLTSSRPDIMFVVCAYARYQVNPKVSYLHAVKMIFSDYAGASLDMKSTIGGCQFFGSRLISWQCKKQTMVANSTTEAEYVAASSCCGQVLWIQNQLLDYGYNFMHTKIFIDNNKKAKKSVRLMMEKLVIRENRQRVLVSKRIERVGENKNRKRAVWNKNRQSDLVSKRIERICELKNRKRVEYIKNRQSVWTGIGVNAVNAARHNLLLLVKVNAARHNLLLLGYYCWAKVNVVEGQNCQWGSTVTSPSRWKKIIITELTVRKDLQLEDAEGVDCLPNSTIFEQLTLMGYEKISQKLTFYKAFFSQQWKLLIHTILQCLSSKPTACHEFSSTMASAIICLATN
ncbi:putative ribonuclease H-like domain-containing protein [Tanacetum coccineum]